ncbi:aspartate racemase [Flavobacterium degerlachei]|uniref:Aspartate racemase n=2 Tax=Flavobacterium degerlachei TaxID=229203 RepID=A0A1H3EUU6_9FLAO|nr:aspartate racemase [Flavobacterium degerlachei]
MKLGILGLGSRSTLFYINELNTLYNQEKGGYSSCPFMLLNSNFDTINSLLPDTSDSLNAIVQDYIKELEKMDIESILIPNITLHETIDRLVIKKRIIHPIHLAIAKIKENNWTKIVLLGSLHSMQSQYISSAFKAKGIEVALPSEEDRFLVDEVRKRVYAETETIGLIEDYYLLIEKYTKDNPVVLACTELSVFKPMNNNNLLDMAQLQIIEAVQIVL